MTKKKLGRGLEALIKPVDFKPTSQETDNQEASPINELSPKSIFPNRYQPRRHFDQEKLEELRDSIIENGIIQPLIVTQQEEGRYELIAGERRLQAAKLANLEKVPVVIREATRQQMLQLAIIENVQRENLNPIEEAASYQRLREEFNYTHSEIATAMGKDRTTISNFLRLLSLENSIRELLLQKKISMGHAKVIMQAEPEQREAIAATIAQKGLSVRASESLVKSSATIVKNKKAQLDFSQLEHLLKDKYNVSVKVQGSNSKGKVVFSYQSKSQKEELLKLLTDEK